MIGHPIYAYDWSRRRGTYQMFQFKGKVKDLRKAFDSILKR